MLEGMKLRDINDFGDMDENEIDKIIQTNILYLKFNYPEIDWGQPVKYDIFYKILTKELPNTDWEHTIDIGHINNKGTRYQSIDSKL